MPTLPVLWRGIEVWHVAQAGPRITVRTYSKAYVEFHFIGDPIPLNGQPDLEVRPIEVDADPGISWPGKGQRVHIFDTKKNRRWLGELAFQP